ARGDFRGLGRPDTLRVGAAGGVQAAAVTRGPAAAANGYAPAADPLPCRSVNQQQEAEADGGGHARGYVGNAAAAITMRLTPVGSSHTCVAVRVTHMTTASQLGQRTTVPMPWAYTSRPPTAWVAPHWPQVARAAVRSGTKSSLRIPAAAFPSSRSASATLSPAAIRASAALVPPSIPPSWCSRIGRCGAGYAAPPVGPKRSVFPRAGACPSATSAAATPSTSKVGPQTKTCGCSAGG